MTRKEVSKIVKASKEIANTQTTVKGPIGGYNV
jgi:hypothetical protein